MKEWENYSPCPTVQTDCFLMSKQVFSGGVKLLEVRVVFVSDFIQLMMNCSREIQQNALFLINLCCYNFSRFFCLGKSVSGAEQAA